MQRNRVAITGMGVVSALGFQEDAVWQALAAGRSGIRRIQAFDPSTYKSQNGAEVDSAALDQAVTSRNLRSGERVIDMAMLAAADALEQAGISTAPDAPHRPTGVIFGTGFGPTHSLTESFLGYAAKGNRGVRPTAVPRCMANAISSQLSMRFHLTGPNYVVIAACTSSTNAIGIAYRMIRDGYATQVLCGGADALFTPAVYAAWDNLGAMSRQADPARASRPFDAARDGFVLGEGAGAFVLEAWDPAQARGARIRAEILGYGESSDASHITRPSAEGQAAALRTAVQEAGIAPSAIGYISAHGTSTPLNDTCECQSIRLALGDAADSIPVGSTKSYVGHLLGASGVVEALAAVQTLEHRLIPANLNLDSPDPACTVCLVGREPRPLERPVVIKNSFGFGGSNAVLVLAAPGK